MLSARLLLYNSRQSIAEISVRPSYQDSLPHAGPRARQFQFCIHLHLLDRPKHLNKNSLNVAIGYEEAEALCEMDERL